MHPLRIITKMFIGALKGAVVGFLLVSVALIAIGLPTYGLGSIGIPLFYWFYILIFTTPFGLPIGALCTIVLLADERNSKPKRKSKEEF